MIMYPLVQLVFFFGGGEFVLPLGGPTKNPVLVIKGTFVKKKG